MSTVQKKSQQAKMAAQLRDLLEKESLFQAVLDSIPDAIEIIDQKFNVLYLNSAAENRTGRGIKEQRGEKCHKVFYDREEPCVFCPAKRTFETGEPGYVLLKDVRVRKAEPCFEELLSLPVKSGGGKVEWVVEIAKDVTKEKETEQKLIDSDRLISIGEMAASLAHEFNNPLGIILGFAQDLLTEVEPADPRYGSLKIIEEEARRCKNLMADLMQFGRPAPIQFLHVAPGESIRKALELISGQIQKGKIQTVVHIDKDLPKVWADPQRLQQVLVNLYFNAIEAMPEGGVLKIEARPEQAASPEGHMEDSSPGPAVLISVSDTGHGIDPNDLPKIFRTFFTTKQKKGMGLGLSICQSIIKSHGGRIAVESNRGDGTTFHISIPLERRRKRRRERDLT